jgi:glycerol-3-phosphate dehydrogenase
MAKDRRTGRVARGRKASADTLPHLYLGCFYFDEPDESDRTGSFQLIVEATTPEDAIARSQAKLRRLRTSGTFFSRPTTIFIEGIIRLTGSFKRGLLVNYEWGERPPPPDVRITCLIPEQPDHDAEGFGWRASKKRRKPTDVEHIEPFVDFGGGKIRRGRAEAERALERTALALTNPVAPTSPRTRSLDTGTTTSKHALKEAARADAVARNTRRELLAATLLELERRGGEDPTGLRDVRTTARRPRSTGSP